MNILMITSEFPPYLFGGLGTYVCQLTDAITEMDDIKMSILLMNPRITNEDPKDVEKLSDNVEVIYLNGPLAYGEFSKEGMEKVAGLMKEKYIIDDYDVILSHCNNTFYLSKLLSDSVFNVSVVHSFRSQHMTNTNKTKMDENLETMKLEQNRIKSADLLIFAAKNMVDICREYYSEISFDYEVIYPGIQIDHFQKEDDSIEPFRDQVAFKHERIITFSGRIVGQKGPQYLLKAFDLLCEKYDDLRLVICGNGFFTYLFKSVLSNWKRISVLGYQDYTQLAKIYRFSDIGVVPSIWEPFGYVILEMMASGTPVVASNLDGPKEIITPDYDGLLVDYSENEESGLREIDVDDLVEKISYLLDNPKQGKRLSENAIGTLEKRFTNTLMAEQFLELFEKHKDKEGELSRCL